METENPALEKIRQLETELAKVIVGQERMIERLVVGLLSGGHVLLEGVPGLAKTLTISTLAQALGLSFQRIQFTPDLLPADLIGTMIFNQQRGEFEVKKGPIFANLILADEVNRSPAKVQAALLESMQERQVTIGEDTFALERPFMVMATQNPVEQEGTYPLPEAQMDRFMLKVDVEYPSAMEEELILQRAIAPDTETAKVKAVLSAQDIFELRTQLQAVTLNAKLQNYIVQLVQLSRTDSSFEGYLRYGASPRATIALAKGARALAFMRGRAYALPQDVKDIAPEVLQHRLLLSFEAEAEGVTAADMVQRLLSKVPI